MKKTLIIVAGPTASGKTQLAIEVARHFNTEIVSADSRQFYKELKIGTAVPTPDELNLVAHHFIGSHSITENINAGDYGVMATKLLNNLFIKYNVVVLTGGSGLYIDAVINGMDDLPKASPEIREFLALIYKEQGITSLQKLLFEKDPVRYQEIDIHNPQRISRALEVCMTSGKLFSELKGKRKLNNEWNMVMVGINWPRQELYSRINDRVNYMISNGLEKETESVVIFRNYNALQTVGYKEMFDYLEGRISLQQAIDLIGKNTRNYAKRQLTWFRKYKEMIWFEPGKTNLIIAAISKKINEVGEATDIEN